MIARPATAPGPALALVLVLAVALPPAAGCGEGGRVDPVRAGAPAKGTAPVAAAASAQQPAAVCEHGVPRDLCTRCEPELIPVFQATGDWCAEHGVPESQCRICNPTLKPVPLAKPLPKVTLASAQTERDAGIEAVRVERRRFTRTLDVVGTLEFDQNRLAQLSARGDGLVVEVKVDVGDEVKAGEALVVVTSAAVGEDRARLGAARARLQAAEAALAREKKLAESRVSSQRDVEQAEREVALARAEASGAEAALRAAGASASGGGGGRYVLAAPFAGTVVARDAVIGRTVAAGQVLVEVADLATLWALLDVPEEDASLVRPGQRASLTLEGTRGDSREGTIARVAASVDRHTRTVRARVELPNPGRSLQAGRFLRARIQVAAEQEALLVPREAVQRSGDASVVFVRKAPGSYEPVVVQVSPATDREVVVEKGLEPGAEVVTTGAFLLKTELRKDSIGAGCCDVEEGK